MQTDNRIQRESLLQEGVSCALATMHAIEAADLFRAVPQGDAAKEHNHGCSLLAMLDDQLRRIQEQVDALSGITSAAEGR